MPNKAINKQGRTTHLNPMQASSTKLNCNKQIPLITQCLAYLSASSPAKADTKKAGNIKSPTARAANVERVFAANVVISNITNEARAVLRKLLLKVSKNWVALTQKKAYGLDAGISFFIRKKHSCEIFSRKNA